ncbi:MAG: beta/gamma crystallin-related protein [Burkholderiales bacterium]
MPSLRHLACALLVAGSTGALAQEIVLFQGDNFSGPRFSASSSVQDLARVGFNDRASSVTVRGGSWQLCTDAYFRGQCVTLSPGDYPSLNAMGIGNQVSSLREVGWGGGGGSWQGGGSITLYESPGLSGRAYTLNGDQNNFAGTGFNDRASSAVVSAGTWQLCADADFAGSCNVFGPGRYNDLAGVTGRVSSARVMPDNGGGRPPGGGGGGWGGHARVVLYEGQNFQGRSFTVDQDVVRNFGNTSFNDRASSLRIERGYWMFCTDADFGGECRTFGPGDYPTLSWFNNQISSGRRISNDYPYNAPPRWGN